MNIGLGMDTGGTYTDAVIMDLDTGEILAKAKSMTTREDLSIGIRGALDALDPAMVADVGVVALSSTLATNSVVEGKGCRVGLVCMGGDYSFDIPVDHHIRVAGSHDLHGDEDVPLDVEEVERFLRDIRGKVDGLAVSGFMSVRNPEHEVLVRGMAREILGVPVVCSHELTTSLGFSERTTTCIMNSRLIPVIDELIASVERVLRERGVRAPLMMFRGDGSMMGSDLARERPVETILSGPAASLMGAMHLTGLRDAVIMDMGGTTTDIGILRDGRPHLEPEGAIIGGKRTRVMAAQVVTSGIGGDSRIVVNAGRIEILPTRVMPLCVAAQRWPGVSEYLNMIRTLKPGMSRHRVNARNTVFRTEFLRTLRIPEDGGMLGEADMELLRLLSERPFTMTGAVMELHRDESEFNVPLLEEYGFLQRIGLTPTDILHVDGTYVRFDADASRAAVEHMAPICGMTVEGFAAEARRIIRERLATELVDALLSEATGDVDLGRSGRELVRMAISGEPGRDIGCSLKVGKPIVGIGAPSGVYIRWMEDIFGTRVVIDDNSDVGNAVGAITAVVSEHVEVLIRPLLRKKSGGRYEAFSRMGRFLYPDIETADADQERMAREFVVSEAERSNAQDIEVSVERDRHRYMEAAKHYDADEIVLRVRATGKPRRF